MKHTIFAIGAHPDDIEFMMSGTLLLLGQAGCEIHYLNIANGSNGTASLEIDEITLIRQEEAQAAATLLNATFHGSLVNDLEIFFEKKTALRLGAIIREVAPTILLVPSPEDYMEDHTNACRLAVTAAFCRGMRNWPVIPATAPTFQDTTLYHALPYGLRDGLRRLIPAGQYVDVSPVLEEKKRILAQHQSQQQWLDVSQGQGAYLNTMHEMARTVGKMSGCFKYAEGWRRHSHLGFSKTEQDPLTELLGAKIFVDLEYEKRLGEI